MAIPSGWHYTDRSRRNVMTPTGEVVSRQSAENHFARQYGFRSEYERKHAVGSAGFQSFTQRPGYERAMQEARDNGKTRAEANAAFARFYANQDRNSRDRSPDGPLANMLVTMGRRSPNDTSFVGDSPSIH